MGKHFRAPWGTSVKVLTIAAALILLVVAVVAAHPLAYLGTAATLLGCLAFSVRGYTVENGQLIVHRFGWHTTIDLRSLVRAVHDPSAMSGSIRTFGVGGLFGFIGHFYNRRLGAYRAYATDVKRAVFLETAEHRFVVTPDSPPEFVESVRATRAA